MKGAPSFIRPMSWTVATCSLFTRARARASRTKRSARVPSSKPGSSMILRARRSRSSVWMADTTIPIAPAPRTCSTRYLSAIRSPGLAGAPVIEVDVSAAAAPRATISGGVPRGLQRRALAFGLGFFRDQRRMGRRIATAA